MGSRWWRRRRLRVSVAHEVGVEGWVVGAWHCGGHGGGGLVVGVLLGWVGLLGWWYCLGMMC